MSDVRHFLELHDVSVDELKHLIQRAHETKQNPHQSQPLKNKVVALAFQKPSMRTRVAFEVAVNQLGGAALYLGKDDIQLGKREPVRDVARVMSRYVDAIVVRMYGHDEVKEMAANSRVPVINGLSDGAHPCQALADILTLQEHFKKLEGLKVTYVGDGNNVLHSLARACVRLGIHLTVSTPQAYKPDGAVWKEVCDLAKTNNTQMVWEEDPQKAVKGTQAIYTDVWISMGQEEEAAQKRDAFAAYQVNAQLLALADSDCRVLHCLPAHRGEEITDEVMESPQSSVYDQAENRLHAQRALLEFLLGGRKS